MRNNLAYKHVQCSEPVQRERIVALVLKMIINGALLQRNQTQEHWLKPMRKIGVYSGTRKKTVKSGTERDGIES